MKLLLAVTALCALAASGIWLFDRYQSHLEWQAGWADREYAESRL